MDTTGLADGLIAENARLRARAEHAEGQVSALRAHNTRWQTEKTRADQAEAERDALKAELAEIKRITEPPTDDEEIPTDPAELKELWEFINRQTRWQYHMAHKFAGQVGGLRAELAEAKRVMAAQPKPSHVEELRDIIVEILGDPDETSVEAFLSFASAEVARIAGGEMVARWKAEDELAEARAAIERVREMLDAMTYEPLGPPGSNDLFTVGRYEMADRVRALLPAALDAPQRREDTTAGTT